MWMWGVIIDKCEVGAGGMVEWWEIVTNTADTIMQPTMTNMSTQDNAVTVGLRISDCCICCNVPTTAPAPAPIATGPSSLLADDHLDRFCQSCRIILESHAYTDNTVVAVCVRGVVAVCKEIAAFVSLEIILYHVSICIQYP